MKINVKEAEEFLDGASEEQLEKGTYTVTSAPGGAGYWGKIDQTHCILIRDDGLEVCMPVCSFESQIRMSPNVEVIEE